jgi:hypothetical protein
VFTPQQQYTRHAWKVNLDHYIDCFWLVGLALALELPNPQWQRLLVLIGNEGEDHLLDRIIASRQIGCKIGDTLCHPKPTNDCSKPLTPQRHSKPGCWPTLCATGIANWTVRPNPAMPRPPPCMNVRTGTPMAMSTLKAGPTLAAGA